MMCKDERLPSSWPVSFTSVLSAISSGSQSFKSTFAAVGKQRFGVSDTI